MKPVRIASILVVSALFACSGNQSNNANAALQPVTEPADAQTAAESPADAQSAESPDAEPDATLDAASEPDAQVATDAATPTDAARDAARTSAHTTGSHTGASAANTSAGATSNSNASAALAEARGVFDRTCGRCHPGGNERVGPRLAGRNDSEAHTRQVVRNGDGTMRAIPVSRLSDPDLAKVIVFLRSIRAVR